MKTQNFVLTAVLSLVSLHAAAYGQSVAADANWPQWRGPLGTGVAPHADPPTKWDDKTNIQWKVRIPGDGTSTPIIWGDQVFIQTAKPALGGPDAALAKTDNQPKAKGPPLFEKGKGPLPSEKGKGGFPGKGAFGGKGGRGGFGGNAPPADPYQFILLCLDRKSGKTLWEKVCREEVPHQGTHQTGSFAASSALTDGEHVFAFFGSRGLYCYDLKGNLKWEKDLGNQETKLGFGEGATPALHGNTIVVQWDHEGDDFLVALDKRTGSELWREQRDEPTTWTTPLIVEHSGRAQVVTSGKERVRSYDLATGSLIWETEGLTENVIPAPVVGNDIVYVTSGYRGSKLLAIRLGSTGDLTGSNAILWRSDRDTPYVASPLLSGDRLYFFKSRDTILTCLDAKTGKPHYTAQRIDGLSGSVYASPVAAAGRVYLVDRNGTCVVIKDADRFEILATNVLDDPTDASPAIVGNQLFLRSRQNLYCIAP